MGGENRKRDKWRTEALRSSQSGMVGGDVLLCCFCSSLLTSYDAHFSNGGDVFCRKCGDERGLIELPLAVAVKDALMAVDAISFGDTGAWSGVKSGLVGYHPERLTGRREDRRRESEMREIEREIAREERRVVRFSGELQREIEREIAREERRVVRLERQFQAAISFRDRADARRGARWMVTFQSEVEARAIVIAREQLSEKRDWMYDTSIPIAENLYRYRVARRIKLAGCSYVFQSTRKQIIREEKERLKAAKQTPTALPLVTQGPPRKFTNAEVVEIRSRYATRTTSQQRLADEYGTTQSHIYLVVTGSLYKRAGGPIHLPRPDRQRIWDESGLVGPWAVDRLARAGLVLHAEGPWFRVDLGSPAFDEFRDVAPIDTAESGVRLAVDALGSAEDVERREETAVRQSVVEDRAADGKGAGASNDPVGSPGVAARDVETETPVGAC